jgi:hypothetical protein
MHILGRCTTTRKVTRTEWYRKKIEEQNGIRKQPKEEEPLRMMIRMLRR